MGSTLIVPGAFQTLAAGIDGTNIVGYYFNGSIYQGFQYNGSSYTTMNVPGAVHTYPFGISGNNIVGEYYNIYSGGTAQGFMYNGSNYTSINFPGAVETSANGISADGKIVGTYEDNSGVRHGFLATPVSRVISLQAISGVSGVTIEWPSFATNYVLQTTIDPVNGPWSQYTLSPVLEGSFFQITVPTTNSMGFFRLLQTN
jgi:probable HAF family extracellular repeat protein